MHHEALAQRVQGGVGLRHVVGIDTRHEERLEVALLRRGELLGGAQAGFGGQRTHPPGRGHVDPGLRRGDGAAARQQTRQAARRDGPHVARAARHPRQTRPAADRLGGDLGQQTRLAGGSLTDEDDGALPQVHGLEGLRLGSGCHGNQRRGEFLRSPGRERRERGDLEAVLAHRLAQPQENHGGLVLGFVADQHHVLGGLEIRVGDVHSPSRDAGGQELGLLLGCGPGTEVDVVGAEHGAREPRVGVGVLDGQPAARQHTDRGSRGLQPGDGGVDGLGPARDLQDPVAPDQRPGQAVLAASRDETETPLVTEPFLVHLGGIARLVALDLVVPVVGADLAAARAVVAGGGGRLQVEGPRLEAVGRRGERTHRADLHDVAGEVGIVGVLLVEPDLLQRAAFHQRDERVAGDLLREPGAAGAQHAAFAVEEDLRGDVDRLRVGAFHPAVTRLAVPVAERLVLQGALAALVADGAVERVVDQQQLQDALLGAFRHGRADLGAHHHALGNRHGAGGLGFGETAAVARVGDLDQALPAGPDGVEQRMVAEPGNGGADHLGGPDDEGSLRDADRDVVDGEGDEIRFRRHLGCGVGWLAHRRPPSVANNALRS